MRIFVRSWPFFVSAAILAALFLLYLYLLDLPVTMSQGVTEFAEYGQEAIRHHNYRSIPPLNYATGLLIGLFGGGLLGAILSQKYKLKLCSFRSGMAGAALQGVAGGFLIMLGGEIAGDMFLGQIASAMQLSGGAWLYLGCAMLAAGIVTVLGFNAVEKREKQAAKAAAPGKDERK